MDDWKPIVGVTTYPGSYTTPQSSTRIAQNTSLEIFLNEEGKTLDRMSLIKAWMKHLFIASSSTKKMKELRGFYAAELSKHLKDLPGGKPIACGVELYVVFTYPWNSTTPKKITSKFDWIYKITRPDCDNMLKALQDAFERVGILGDDAVIARLIVEKRHGEISGIKWRLKPLPMGKEKDTLL